MRIRKEETPRCMGFIAYFFATSPPCDLTYDLRSGSPDFVGVFVTADFGRLPEKEQKIPA
jgi:hypothetical protein